MRASHCGVSGHRGIAVFVHCCLVLRDLSSSPMQKCRRNLNWTLAFFPQPSHRKGHLWRTAVKDILVVSPPFLHIPATIMEKAGARTPPALMQRIWVSSKACPRRLQVYLAIAIFIRALLYTPLDAFDFALGILACTVVTLDFYIRFVFSWLVFICDHDGPRLVKCRHLSERADHDNIEPKIFFVNERMKCRLYRGTAYEEKFQCPYKHGS